MSKFKAVIDKCERLVSTSGVTPLPAYQSSQKYIRDIESMDLEYFESMAWETGAHELQI
jgi:hypothetical protein